MFIDAYRGREVSRFMCTYALTLSVFMFQFYGVLFYLQKFNIASIQRGYICQEWLFFSNEINFCCNEISFFFYFKLLFRTKVSQNGFNFNQIESQAYSKFSCDNLLSKNRTKVSQNGFNFDQIESQVYSKFQCDTSLFSQYRKG